jgi:F-type H+-transporting ATPase subunit epsilon
VNLEVMTRDRVVFSGEVDAVILPALEGEMGVLPGHADFIVMLGKGSVKATGPSLARSIPVSGGFAEVSHDRVVILPNVIETSPTAGLGSSLST